MPLMFIAIVVLVCVFGFWGTLKGLLLGALVVIGFPFMLLFGLIAAVFMICVIAALFSASFK